MASPDTDPRTKLPIRYGKCPCTCHRYHTVQHAAPCCAPPPPPAPNGKQRRKDNRQHGTH